MKKIALFVSILFLFFSCNKEKGVSGTVRDYGPVAVDGCGWVIQVGDEIFHPTNIDTQYQVDNLKIKFDYKHLGTDFYCGLLPTIYEEIEILSIK